MRPNRRAILAVLALSLMTTVGWFLSLGIVRWQRQRLVHRLAERTQSDDDANAIRAIRGLTMLNETAVEPLVAAAFASRPRVAPAARWEVDDLLSRWQREFDAGVTSSQHALRLDRLAEALACGLAARSPEQLVWARQLTERILRAAGNLPVRERRQIVQHCETVLQATRIVAHEVSPSTLARQVESPTARSLMAPAVSETANSLPAMLTEASPLGLPAAVQAAESFEPAVIGSARGRFSDPAAPSAADAAFRRHGSGQSRSVAWQPDRQAGGREAVAANEALSWLDPATSHAAQSSPSGRYIEPRPGSEPALTATRPAGSSPQLSSPKDGVLDDIQPLPHQLLNRLAFAPADEARHLQDQLVRRGLGKVTPEVARLLVSNSADDRAQAVDALLKTPGGRPGPWLILLADDPAPEVRLAVVTLLATSNDPRLVEKAWQVALRDEDPRVAGLAEWLQQRRAALPRR